MSEQPKIALVHDDFTQSGGAENLFAQISKIFPEAPIYTSFADWDKLPATIGRNMVRPSFIQKIPLAKNIFKYLLPIHPLAFESFNFNKFDVVLSSTTRFSKGIITRPETIHICYINSVPRFLWNEEVKKQYLPKILIILLSPFLKWLARWDKVASSRVDAYIANSKNVAQKVKEHYGVDSEVIYPAVDTDFFDLPKSKKSNDFFLVVSRFVKWKKIDIAIKASQDLGINLKIVGTGPDEARLKNLVNSAPSHNYSSSESKTSREVSLKTINILTVSSRPASQAPASTSRRRGEKRGEQARTITQSIEFLSNITRTDLRELYQNAKALIVTQEEDFGIAMAEAQACGTPVIAYKNGGAPEIVIDNQTGLFFKRQDPKSLEDAITRASKVKWEGNACRENALRFSQAQFVNKLKSRVAHYAKLS